MKDEENDIVNLIGKQLTGEASPQEQQLVEAWCNASADNQQYFNHVKIIFEKASIGNDATFYNEDIAWKAVQAKLKATKRRFIFSNQNLRIAASVLIVSAIGILTYQKISPQVITEELASATTIVKDSLPDGTQVVLNKHSSLTVSYNPKTKTGKIKLRGEANFEIKHDAEKELIFEVDEVFIRDIGTSFNVKDFPESNTVEVTVQEGEVKFYTAKDRGISVKAGGKGVYNKQSKKFLLLPADTNVISYKTKLFVFEEMDLRTIVHQVNSVYDKQIKIADNLKTCRVTVNFNNEEIETIAEILAATLDLTISTSGNEITLEGEGCE